MKTTTIVIGQNDKTLKTKPIEFKKLLSSDLEIWDANERIQRNGSPHNYKYIELICKDYTFDNFDLMYAYNNPSNRNEGCLFFGKWNDGFVGE